MEQRRALRRAITGRRSVKIERVGDDWPAVNGFPLALGRQLALVHAVPEFDPDGYQALPVAMIARVESDEYERFVERVLRDERRLTEIWPVRGAPARSDLPLEDWRELFQAFGITGELVIIECEGRNGGDDFYLGPVVAVAGDAVAVHHVDGTGVWDQEPSVIPFDAITRVRFGERYTDVFARHAGGPPDS